MAEWTREALVEAFPLGTVQCQIDDEVRPMTADEWNVWLDRHTGQERDE